MKKELRVKIISDISLDEIMAAIRERYNVEKMQDDFGAAGLIISKRGSGLTRAVERLNENKDDETVNPFGE